MGQRAFGACQEGIGCVSRGLWGHVKRALGGVKRALGACQEGIGGVVVLTFISLMMSPLCCCLRSCR